SRREATPARDRRFAMRSCAPAPDAGNFDLTALSGLFVFLSFIWPLPVGPGTNRAPVAARGKRWSSGRVEPAGFHEGGAGRGTSGGRARRSSRRGGAGAL